MPSAAWAIQWVPAEYAKVALASNGYLGEGKRYDGYDTYPATAGASGSVAAEDGVALPCSAAENNGAAEHAVAHNVAVVVADQEAAGVYHLKVSRCSGQGSKKACAAP
jgi:hypothetical protein